MRAKISLGRRLLLYLLSCSLGFILFFSTFIWLKEDVQADQQGLSLFWNGYAKLYYEETESLNGLQDRLNRDRYMVVGELLDAALFYDANGSAVANIGDKQDLAGVKKLPILSDGTVVGYTATKAQFPQRSLVTIIVLSVIFSILCYLGCRYHYYKLSRSSLAAERAIATRLIHRITGTPPSNKVVGIDELEQQLQQLLTKVEKLETVRRTMVAEIAHELRTPLAIMRSQLENALYSGQPLPMEKVISLHEENIRLIKLVKDLQELSLAESGHLPLDKDWFSLNELIESVIEALSVEGEERSIVTNLVASQEIRIHADQDRIRQVIVNLLGNAYKHARGRVDVDVKLHNHQAMFTITDDGWGMEEEDLAHVFDRFYRAGDYSTSKENSTGGDTRSGIGLGLAIVKEFVQAHQGAVQVQSQFGKGASFQVILPVVAE